MQACAAVADLRAGDERQTVAKTGGRGRTSGALRDILVHFAVLIGTRSKPLDRRHDHLRVDALNLLPGKTHAIEHAGAEVLHENVASPDQGSEDFLAFWILGVQRDRALVVI